MSEDVTGPKSGWNNASDGLTSSTVQQPERSKSNATTNHLIGSSFNDTVTGVNRLSLSSASPSVTFPSSARQR